MHDVARSMEVIQRQEQLSRDLLHDNQRHLPIQAASSEGSEVLVHGLKNHANVGPVWAHMRKAVEQNKAMQTTGVGDVVGLDVLQHLHSVDRLRAAVVFGFQDLESYVAVESAREVSEEY